MIYVDFSYCNVFNNIFVGGPLYPFFPYINHNDIDVMIAMYKIAGWLAGKWDAQFIIKHFQTCGPFY